MAREHARIWLDINDDEDFCDLTPQAQWLYTRIILTEPTLNYCGVADWRPQRLTGRARGLTVPFILTTAAELEARNYLLFDLGTEEVLARSYVRRDELLRNPKMAATVIKAYPAVASKVLRAAVITEVQRIHEKNPEYSSWRHKDTAEGLARMLSKRALQPGDYTHQITIPDPVENTYPDVVQNGNPHSVKNTDLDHGADNQSFSVPNPSTSTLHPSPAPLEGYVSTEGHQSADPDPNTPRPVDRCPRHTNHPNPPACRACADARHTAEAWDAAREATEHQRRAAFRAELEACDACGSGEDAGWALDDDGTVAEPLRRCERHTWPTAPAVTTDA